MEVSGASAIIAHMQQVPPAPPSLVTLSPVQSEAILRQIDTTILPDGASCYVINDGLVYRLRKDATPGPGLVTPNSGPGAWQGSIGDSVLEVSVSPSAGVPGTIAGTDDASASLVPTTPLLATDKIMGVSVADSGDTPGFPTEAYVYGTVDTTTVPGDVRLRLVFGNVTANPVTVPDGLTYTAYVWRRTPVG